MRSSRATRLVLASLAAVLLPAIASAQGTIAGLVRDSSGAVLPGVTVEAARSVLIEKARTAVTDNTGRYQIVDLRAGTYEVLFTLPGFSTVKREGIELTGVMTVAVNAELRVGEVQEAITVTGESPVIDVQSVRRQATISGEVLSTIPTARGYTGVMLLVPAIQTQCSSPANVQATPGMVVFGTPGGRNGNEGRLQVDGLGVGAARNGGGVSGYNADIANAQEITFKGRLSPQQRRSQPGDADTPLESAQAAHSISRVVRAGAMDTRAHDAARRAAIRPCVELRP